MTINKTNEIIVRGAHKNNLKDVDINISKGAITVFTGVSGSGKSSLVLDTIASESMRLLKETFPVYIRNRMPLYPDSQVEFIDNLTPAIVIDQKQLSNDIRSTVGTITDIAPVLRLLFSRFADNSCGDSNRYSFNSPDGMCQKCQGLGVIRSFDMEKVIDKSKSLNEEAIRLPGFQIDSYQWQMYANSGLFDNDKKLEDYSDEEWQELLHGKDHIVSINNNTGKVWDNAYNLTYEGLKDRIDRLYLTKTGSNMSKAVENIINNFTVESVCPECEGQRLNEAARKSLISGLNIWQIGQLEISELAEFMEALDISGAEQITMRIGGMLRNIESIGLGYLTLNRSSKTLSGGETQRLKVVRNLGSPLTGMTYVFDEPSVGLHPADVDRLIDLLLDLKKRGNTVLIVEHNKRVIECADYIVEMGPGAGSKGGSIVFEGELQALRDADTFTAKWLSRPVKINREPVKSSEVMKLRNCHKNNLKHIDVDIPKSALTVISGVAGSGKSTLLRQEILEKYPEAVHISQAAIGTTIKSTPATYIGIMDAIRKIFAKSSGLKAAQFSYNSQGACPVCGGKGVVITEMAFLEPVESVCEACGGKRYSSDILAVKYHDKSIADVMEMTADDAIEFFDDAKITKKLKLLNEVGLDYLTLGQPTSTLSGGECQRIKLVSHLGNREGIYVMDEPSAGLHGQDVEKLINLLKRLVAQGNTVIVADHNLDIIGCADYVIDLGPEAGKNGGRVMAQGTPVEIAECSDSMTGRYLRKYL